MQKGIRRSQRRPGLSAHGEAMSLIDKALEWALWLLIDFWWAWLGMIVLQLILWMVFGFSWRSSIPAFVLAPLILVWGGILIFGGRVGP
jgi:hypothetical protein